MQPENVPTATRKRNIALLGVLGLICLILYALTVTKFADSAGEKTPEGSAQTTGEAPAAEQPAAPAQ